MGSSSHGSDSLSVSSLSSGTPLGSISGFSQVTLPVSLPLGSEMPDACSSADIQFHPDSQSDCQSEHLRTVSRGPVELLKDSVIQSEDRRESRKRSLLMDLNQPSPLIRRTQSHMTTSGRAWRCVYMEWFDTM